MDLKRTQAVRLVTEKLLTIAVNMRFLYARAALKCFIVEVISSSIVLEHYIPTCLKKVHVIQNIAYFL